MAFELSLRTKCPPCRGQRTILSLGNLRKQCTTCKGTGYIEMERTKEPDQPVEKIMSKKEIRKYQLKKKTTQLQPEPELITPIDKVE